MTNHTKCLEKNHIRLSQGSINIKTLLWFLALVLIGGLSLKTIAAANDNGMEYGIINPQGGLPIIWSKDVEAPVITVQGSNPLYIEEHTLQTYTDAGATATDNVDSNVTVTRSGTVNVNVPGTYPIKYTATDSQGNTAEVTRNVIITKRNITTDTTPPVITMKGSIPAYVTMGSVPSYDEGATAIDNIDGVVAITTNSNVNTQVEGDYTITYTARDTQNNVATATRDVYVRAAQVAGPPTRTAGRATTWGMDRIDQLNPQLDGLTELPNDGRGVTVYIVGSGVQGDLIELGGNRFGPFVPVNQNKFLPGWSTKGTFVDENPRPLEIPYIDCFGGVGHGTQNAMIIGGVTKGLVPGVKMVSVRVTGSGRTRSDCRQTNRFYQAKAMIDGLNWIARNARLPAVVNISGYLATYDSGFAIDYDNRGQENELRNALTAIVNRGISIVIGGTIINNASPKDGDSSCVSLTATMPGVIQVSSTQIVNRNKFNAQDQVFLDSDKCTDIFAPGKDLNVFNIDDQPLTVEGTSFAIPHVTAAVAMLLSANPGMRPTAVEQAIKDSATRGVLPNNRFGQERLMLYAGLVTPNPTNPNTPAPTQPQTSPSVTTFGVVGNASEWQVSLGAPFVKPNSSTSAMRSNTVNISSANLGKGKLQRSINAVSSGLANQVRFAVDIPSNVGVVNFRVSATGNVRIISRNNGEPKRNNDGNFDQYTGIDDDNVFFNSFPARGRWYFLIESKGGFATSNIRVSYNIRNKINRGLSLANPITDIVNEPGVGFANSLSPPFYPGRSVLSIFNTEAVIVRKFTVPSGVKRMNVFTSNYSGTSLHPNSVSGYNSCTGVLRGSSRPPRKLDLEMYIRRANGSTLCAVKNNYENRATCGFSFPAPGDWYLIISGQRESQSCGTISADLQVRLDTTGSAIPVGDFTPGDIDEPTPTPVPTPTPAEQPSLSLSVKDFNTQKANGHLSKKWIDITTSSPFFTTVNYLGKGYNTKEPNNVGAYLKKLTFKITPQPIDPSGREGSQKVIAKVFVGNGGPAQVYFKEFGHPTESDCVLCGGSAQPGPPYIFGSRRGNSDADKNYLLNGDFPAYDPLNTDVSPSDHMFYIDGDGNYTPQGLWNFMIKTAGNLKARNIKIDTKQIYSGGPDRSWQYASLTPQARENLGIEISNKTYDIGSGSNPKAFLPQSEKDAGKHNFGSKTHPAGERHIEQRFTVPGGVKIKTMIVKTHPARLKPKPGRSIRNDCSYANNVPTTLFVGYKRKLNGELAGHPKSWECISIGGAAGSANNSTQECTFRGRVTPGEWVVVSQEPNDKGACFDRDNTERMQQSIQVLMYKE